MTAFTDDEVDDDVEYDEEDFDEDEDDDDGDLGSKEEFSESLEEVHVKYCRSCGFPNDPSALTCVTCGENL